MVQPIIAGKSPFGQGNYTPRNTLVAAVNGRSKRVDTAERKEPTATGNKFADQPQLVKALMTAVSADIKACKLQNGLDYWEPEAFLDHHKIDWRADDAKLPQLREQARKAAFADFKADLIRDLVEHGITDEAEQARAWHPYSSFEEAISSTGANPINLRLQVNGFSAAAFQKGASTKTQHLKGDDTVTTEEKNRAIDKAFDPNTSEEEAQKIFDAMASQSPDEPTSPVVDKPAETAPEPPKQDEINALRKRLIDLLADAFTGVGNNQLVNHMKTALKADNFQDFLLKHKTIKEAAEAGQTLIDEYIIANAPKQAPEPPPSASVGTSEPSPAPVKQDVRIEPATVATKPEPKTVEQRALPPEHSLSVNWQMNPLEIATFAVQSGLYKGIDTTAKAMMVMLRGLSLQIDPLMALEQINIIEGKTAVSSALMHALVERSGQLEDIKIVETDTQCTVTLHRTGRTPVSATYSTEDAIKAGLTNKYNWKSMPKLMRYHRAFAIAARRCFSDVLLFGGAIYTNEELQPDRNVNEDGDFVTVTNVA